jgi:hypothetical protein
LLCRPLQLDRFDVLTGHAIEDVDLRQIGQMGNRAHAPHCGQAGAKGLGLDMGKRPIKMIDG